MSETTKLICDWVGLKYSKEHWQIVKLLSSVKFVNSLCAFFIYRTAVDTDKESCTVLSPSPLPLPRNILVLMDIQFMELKWTMTNQK